MFPFTGRWAYNWEGGAYCIFLSQQYFRFYVPGVLSSQRAILPFLATPKAPFIRRNPVLDRTFVSKSLTKREIRKFHEVVVQHTTKRDEHEGLILLI